ncbi:MAG: tryptophan-rich sensory protein TspO [Parcubacteria group bacterium GW2011_GWA1_59_11]|nr:MAG: tryptophan-rich sensory protein TspO [Parcubacteria group bacterium GW2011_GWA1_59_11]
MRLNYVLIPLAAILTALAGSYFTNAGMEWYETLILPGFTPPGYAIGAVWTAIYALATASALIFYNRSPKDSRFRITAAIFVANAILNADWSWIFFAKHLLGLAVAEAAVLGATVVALIVLIWPRSRTAAALLVPYAAWVAFATYLAFAVWRLNG